MLLEINIFKLFLFTQGHASQPLDYFKYFWADRWWLFDRWAAERTFITAQQIVRLHDHDGKSQDELDPIKTSVCLLMFIRPCKSKYSSSLYVSPGRLAQAPALRAAKGYFKMNGNSPTPGRGKYFFLCPPSHNISIFRYSEMKARGRNFFPSGNISNVLWKYENVPSVLSLLL